MNEVEPVAVARFAFCEFRRDFGAAENGDYAGCVAPEKSSGDGKSNTRGCTCHYSDFSGKQDFQATPTIVEIWLLRAGWVAPDSDSNYRVYIVIAGKSCAIGPVLFVVGRKGQLFLVEVQPVLGIPILNGLLHVGLPGEALVTGFKALQDREVFLHGGKAFAQRTRIAWPAPHDGEDEQPKGDGLKGIAKILVSRKLPDSAVECDVAIVEVLDTRVVHSFAGHGVHNGGEFPLCLVCHVLGRL